MFSFFWKKPQQTSSAATSHDLKLIPSLTGEHKKMLRMVDEIALSVRDEKLVAATQQLKTLKAALSDHLLTENVRFYGYLENRFPDSSANGKILKEFRTEMDEIAHVALNFIKKYTTVQLEPMQVQAFTSELQVISNALLDRIYREEKTLYPLYHESAGG